MCTVSFVFLCILFRGPIQVLLVSIALVYSKNTPSFSLSKAIPSGLREKKVLVVPHRSRCRMLRGTLWSLVLFRPSPGGNISCHSTYSRSCIDPIQRVFLGIRLIENVILARSRH